jgi:hypothetical protein
VTCPTFPMQVARQFIGAAFTFEDGKTPTLRYWRGASRRIFVARTAAWSSRHMRLSVAIGAAGE